MRLEATPRDAPRDLPSGLLRRKEESQIACVPWDGEAFRWDALVAHVLHPARVAIIEALAWIGCPLSASNLEALFEGSGLYLAKVSYHVKGLADWGVLDIVETRKARGAPEKFYFFSGIDEKADRAGGRLVER
jgi:hypothetical protein